MNKCINWENIIYDKCRFCSGYKAECPEYLSDIEHTRKSPSVEKPFETTDYEPSNGVSASVVHSNSSDIRTHSETLYSRPNHAPKEDIRIDSGEKLSSTLAETSCGDYSRPVEFRRLTLLEAKATTRHFLERFYRSQR